jgi:hypothetical protein
MWIDDGGVAHTVALPDPTEVMSDDFRAGLDALAHSDANALREVIEQAEEQIYEAGWLELSTSAEYVGATPPVSLLRGHVRTARDVANAIDQTDLRWRLDVIMALDDYMT